MTEREIFDAASQIPQIDARNAYLDSVCGTDPALREQVDQLLRASEMAGSFLATPAGEQLTPREPATDVTAVVSNSGIDSPELVIPEGKVPLDFLQPATKPGSLGRLAHYEVMEVLGQGAFGTVLKGFDDKLHRMVAIKVMNSELAATSPPRKRFLREAQSSARVRHDNIVGIHDIQESPLPYLVMEFIPGVTLQQRLDQKGPLDLQDILRIGQQIAAGLAAAHAQGMIHRDIKPANILIESGVEERVKITDFGLARATDDASLTQSGLIVGTPLYMAPEQAKGQPLDHRTDLFSLGSVLYTMASGRPPFRAANTIAVLKRVCDDTPRPINEIIPETPQWLCDIISKLHAKDPEDRFQSAKEVADVLGQHLAFIKEPMKVPRPEPIDLPLKLESAQTSIAHPPVKPQGWTPTTMLLAFIAGVLMIPVIAIVLILVALAVPAYQAAYSRIPVLPAGIQQQGLWFDGKDDYVKAEGLNWTYPQFTLEAFVTSDNDGDNGVIAMLYSNGQKPEAMFLFDGPASSQQRMSGAGVVGQKPFGNAMAPLTTGVRQHRALVFDGQVLNYYVNGVWQGKRHNQAKEGLQWQINNLLIGCKSTDTEFFRGVIDQVRVSRVARYSSNFPPVTTLSADDTTLAMYNFDEGTGDVLNDSSGNNHHAKVFGAKWITSSSSESPAQIDEWITLFNGRDFTGWKGNSHWKVIDGQLVSRVTPTTNNSPAMLVTKREDFRNFHARIEAKINSGGDSGFFFRFGENGDKALQAQITAEPTGIGSVLRETATVAKSMTTIPANTWATMEVLAQGPQITVLVDGLVAAHWTDSSREIPAGPIAFEAGFPGTEIAVRKIEVKRLPASTTPSPAIAPFDAVAAKAHQEAWAKHLGVPVEYTNSIGMKFRLIPPGEFLMGSTAEEIEEALKLVGDVKVWQMHIESEGPQHTVVLTQPIYLGVNEVTQAEYEKIMGVNPSHFAPMGNGKEAVAGLDTAEHPVEMVGWNDAAEFCAKLSQQEKLKPFYSRAGETITPLDGTGYRLPSEAEWEFACRAGTTTKYWTGDKDEDLLQAGWLDRNSGGRTHAAGELKANPFGLFDIHGNIWERVQDGWDATYYGQFTEKAAISPNNPFIAGSLGVIRGGNWQRNASTCRSSKRNDSSATSRDNRIGFRAALSVDAVKIALAERAAPPADTITSWHGWPADAPAIAPFDATVAKAHQDAWAKHLGVPVEYTNSIGMKFRLIPPGEFTMGSTDEEAVEALQVAGGDTKWQAHLRSERPPRKVVISQPFYLGITEVTQDQYQQVAGSNPSLFAASGSKATHVASLETSAFPVEALTWHEAMQFCRQLQEREHLPGTAAYSLPTEDRWEFACRAGTTSRYFTGDDGAQLDQVAWLGQNADGRPHRTGELSANPFGLHDVHGNVWEWMADEWILPPNAPSELPAGQRVLRGGDWTSQPTSCRSAHRHADLPTARYGSVGFRVALSVDAVKASQLRGTPQTPNVSTKQRFASDEWIDVLPLIDPQIDKWTVPQRTGKNAWYLERGELMVERNALASKLILPLDSDWPAYECELEVTRRAGSKGFNLNLPTKRGECPLVFDAPDQGGVHLGSAVKGVHLKAGPQIVTGERTTIRVEVRRLQNSDQVTVRVNNTTVGEWTGDLGTLVNTYWEGFPSERRVSLWILPGGNEFAFHKIRVRMLDGSTAETLRPIASP